MGDFSFTDFNMGGDGSPSDFIPSGGDTGYGGGGYQGGEMPFQAGSIPTFGPDTGSGGGGDWFGKLSGYAKQAIPFLGLGTTALGAYTGVKGMQNANQQAGYLKDAQQRAQQAAAPGIAAGGQLIPAGASALMGGPLPPQLEATVTNWTASEKAKMRQQFAHMGITDSQQIVQAEASIDAQAQQLRAQLAQGLLTGGQGVTGTGIQGAQLEGNLAAREGDAITTALTEANRAVEKLLGMAG